MFEFLFFAFVRESRLSLKVSEDVSDVVKMSRNVDVGMSLVFR
jgi:hypothetical protein